MSTGAEPLVTLRRHAADAPWAVADLAALADRLLAAAGAPLPKPTTDRTLRFYVTRGVVQVPFGRGRGSTWGYPHLVEVLAARLAQLDGEGLDVVAARRASLPLDDLERRVAGRLAVPLPAPPEPVAPVDPPAGRGWQRFALGEGAELHLQDGHLLLADRHRLVRLLDGLREEIAPSPEES
jgi:hypothetical protein